MQRTPKGWPGVRAQVRLQRACATRPIENTGDSSTPLRMTCFAIATGETLSPRLRQNCHPEEACVRRRRNTSVTRKSTLPRRAGRRRIYCSIGSSRCDFYVSIPERQHVRLQRGTEAAKDIATPLRMTCDATNVNPWQPGFRYPGQPVHDRQSNPLFEPHLQESHGSWTAVMISLYPWYLRPSPIIQVRAAAGHLHTISSIDILLTWISEIPSSSLRVEDVARER